MRAVTSAGEARAAGAGVVASLRRGVAQRLASMIRADPEWAADAVEVGLVDRAWLEEPGERPIRTATPVDVMQRFLERSAERRPSVLTSVGLTALQALSMRSVTPDADASGTPVTVVFTDLEGFTRFTTDQGDEAAVALLAEHHRSAGRVIRSRGGRIVKRMGDGLMVVFGEPDAAVLASLELLDTGPLPLRLRAGVHLGEAVVTRDDVLGHVVNVAARITERAQGNEVLGSVVVRDAVGELRGAHFGRPRIMRLKGVEPTSVCTVKAG